jgi:hypothetical protein
LIHEKIRNAVRNIVINTRDALVAADGTDDEALAEVAPARIRHLRSRQGSLNAREKVTLDRDLNARRIAETEMVADWRDTRDS